MVVVVPAATTPGEGLSLPIFVFADEDVWKSSEEWKRRVDLGGATSLRIADPSQLSVDAVKAARSVVFGGNDCSLESWQKPDIKEAFVECRAAGGIITAIGPVCTLLGAWYPKDKVGQNISIARAWNLIPQSVVSICLKSSDISLSEDVVAALHGEGFDTLKGYQLLEHGGAAFFPNAADSSRAEAIGKTIIEVSSISKADSIGKILKIRKITVPDPDIIGSSVVDPGERWKAALELAAKWLVDAKGTAVVSTGAGISAESGIPTYRDPGGLWELYDQMEVSHIKGFARDPLKCWRFELELHQLLKNCGPNAAHKALQHLEEVGVLKAVVTQNVDGLHSAAGSKKVLEIHGSETRGICMNEKCRKTFPYVDVFHGLGWMDGSGATTAAAPPLPKQKRERVKGGIYAELSDSSSDSSSSTVVSSGDESSGSKASSQASKGPIRFKAHVQKMRGKISDPEELARMDTGPRCAVCKDGVLKPDAVYFREPLPKAIIKEAIKVSRASKVFLIVGTSGQVAPACKLPGLAKSNSAAKVIEVSPRETDMSKDADLLLMGSAATILPALVDAVKRRIADMESRNDGSLDASSPLRRTADTDVNNAHARKKLLTRPMRRRGILRKGTDPAEGKPNPEETEV